MKLRWVALCASLYLASGSAFAQTLEPTRRTPPLWSLSIEAPDELSDLLNKHLDLARYRLEAQSPDAADGRFTVSRGELRRLVAAVPGQVRSLLEAQGYFSAQIRTSVSDAVPGQAIEIKVAVVPGPQAKVSRIQMLFEGDLDNLISQDDAQAKALANDLQAEWSMPVGSVFTQVDWSAAKNAMLAAMRAQGFPLASWSGASATVDAQQQSAQLVVVADSGPRFKLGDVVIEGLKAQPESSVLNVASFSKGQIYQEQNLLDFQERIQKLNLFDNVYVTMDFDAAQAEAAPVKVQLRELPLQQANFGVGVSSDTGPRLSIEHLHRHAFAQDWQAKSKLQMGHVDSSLQLDFTSHPQPGRRRWVVSTKLARQLDSDNALTSSELLRFGQIQEGERLERTRYVEFQKASVTSDASQKVSEASSLSALMQWGWRDVDNPTLPTKGITALGSISAGQSFATIDSSGSFGRTYGRLTWYKPLSWGWESMTRVEAGRVFSSQSVSVPDPLLFRAGGDDSVRGYGYRSLGVSRDGVLTGGRAMTTASAEVAHGFLKDYPSILGAVFWDAGGVADQFSDIKFQRGYGMGLRWRSPVGPLRMDLAYGDHTGRIRMHFSVGIAL